MIIKIDKNSYKSSPIYSYITEDLLLVKKSFIEDISLALDTIVLKEKQFESQRIALVGEYIEEDLNEVYLNQLSNIHLRTFLFNGALLYYYSQVEIKLQEICERLPILLQCKSINNFIPRKRGKLNKIAEYLLKYADINIKEIENWQRMSDLYKVRNSIAHTETIPATKKREYQSVANSYKGKIYFNTQSNSIQIEISYLTEIINISFDFIEKIITDIWEKHNSVL